MRPSIAFAAGIVAGLSLQVIKARRERIQISADLVDALDQSTQLLRDQGDILRDLSGVLDDGFVDGHQASPSSVEPQLPKVAGRRDAAPAAALSGEAYLASQASEGGAL